MTALVVLLAAWIVASFTIGAAFGAAWYRRRRAAPAALSVVLTTRPPAPGTSTTGYARKPIPAAEFAAPFAAPPPDRRALLTLRRMEVDVYEQWEAMADSIHALPTIEPIRRPTE